MTGAGGADCLTFENIWRNYGRRRGLRRIHMTLLKGETLVLLGANGAGKSTLLNVASTLLAPSHGRLLYKGAALDAQGRQLYRRSLGFVSHSTFLYDDLDCRENLLLHARLRHLPSPGTQVDDLLRRVSLWSARHIPAGHLSRGMQQRLTLARALLGSPEVLLLDEPTNGLDPGGVLLLRELVETRSHQGVTTLFSTHDLSLGLALGHRYVLLERGEIRVLADCRPVRGLPLEQLTLDSLAGSPA